MRQEFCENKIEENLERVANVSNFSQLHRTRQY